MRKILVLALLLAPAAAAQEPDVGLGKVAGVYNAGCLRDPIDTDVLEGCFARVDLVPVIELGCTSEVSTRPTDVSAGTVYRMDFTVQQTTFDDAEIRCYLNDGELLSDYSVNAGLIDFTPPAKGRLLASIDWCTVPAIAVAPWLLLPSPQWTEKTG
jgi:hypothetical protein